MALPMTDVERLKRKLRKKLRQIENLEIADRELNDEELDKIRKKADIRAELSELLKESNVNVLTEVEKSFTFIERSDVSHESVDAASDKSESNKNKQEAGFWTLDTSEQLEEMKRKSSEYEVDNSEKSVDKKLCTEDVKYEESLTVDIIVSERVNQTNDDEGKLTEKLIKEKSTESVTKKSEVRPGKPEHKSRVREELRRLRNVSWSVEELCGHDDLVLDCDIDQVLDLAVTCSRDTTVKVWSLSSGSLVHSLRGHTGPVTGVRFLSREATELVALSLDNPDLKVAVVSGSQDCSVKVWDALSGSLVKSYYTYNGITRLDVVPNTSCTITGTDGGKLEMYDMTNGHCAYSQRVHEESVSALSVRDDDHPTILSGSQDGMIKLFQLEEETFNLRCLFVSENVKTNPDTSIHIRPVYSVSLGVSGLLYYGDDGCNIKAINWKKGRIDKIANHAEDIGFTDAVGIVGNLLVASTYDIDNGQGGLNLFCECLEEAPLPKYVATLMDGDTSRIGNLRATSSNGTITIITCGQEVKLWRQRGLKGSHSNNGSTSVRGCVLTMDQGLIYDSGSDGEFESDVEEEINSVSCRRQKTESDNLVPYNNKTSGFCNCSIM